MAKLGSGIDNRSVGVDIGKRAVKVSVMGGSPESPVLETYNIRKIPSNNGKTDIAAEVREALSEVDISPQSVNLSISGPEVIVRFVNLPKMTREQLDAALVFEAEKYIPFNIREVVLDSIILGDAPEPGQMKVLIAAAKRKPVEERAAIFRDMGVPVNYVDIDPFAVFNAFMRAVPSGSEKVSAMIDIGHSQTCLLISAGGIPSFMRQINIGGTNIDALISRTLSVDTEKASEFKSGVGDFDAEIVNNCIHRIIDDIVREVQLSFGYFESTCGSPIDGTYCSGGMVHARGVLEHFSKSMGSDVVRWDPLEGIAVSDILSREDLQKVSSSLAVSIGLALRR